MADADSSRSTESRELLLRLATGDEDAATAVFERYIERLTRLARSRLAGKLAARLDPEDIVMSAYRSFFVAARQGRFTVNSADDLWRLLVEVTLHKLYRSVERHLAQRRTVEREHRSSSLASLIRACDPTPDEAVAAADELEAILRQLGPREREVLELRLQGYEHEEIAERLACSERTVRRGLNQVRRLIVAQAGTGFVPSAARVLQGRAAAQPAAAERWVNALLDAPLQWNDFLLRERIGAGATGKVYRATRKADASEVAIKFLRRSLLRSPAAIERFLREAKTVAALAHPGIVPMHGAGRTPGGGLFLVMDLIRGLDLSRLHRNRKVEVNEAAEWVIQAARATAFAHQCGVIHCDLKPSNLIFDGVAIRVTDFGLAVRHAELVPDAGLLAGTPAFMAPEQVDACWGAISPRTDTWGLGGILYFLLFRRPPHYAPDVPGTLAEVVSKTPVRFSDAPGQVPAAMLDILHRCLAKAPEERIASASELADLLQTVMQVV